MLTKHRILHFAGCAGSACRASGSVHVFGAGCTAIVSQAVTSEVWKYQFKAGQTECCEVVEWGTSCVAGTA